MENIKKGLIPFIIGFFVCFLIFTVVGCSDLSSQPTYTKDEIEWATSDALPEALVDMEGVSEVLYTISEDDEFVGACIDYLSNSDYIYDKYEISDMIMDEL